MNNMTLETPLDRDKFSGNQELRSNKEYNYLIPQVRRLVQEKLQQAGSKAYYQFDYDRFMTQEWPARRFLLKCKGSVEAAAQGVINSWAHIKDLELRDIKDDYFIREVFLLGAAFLYEPDRDGRPTMYVRPANRIAVKELNDLGLRYMFKLILESDDIAGERGLTVVADVRDITVADLDMTLAIALARASSHLPFSAATVIVLDLPFFARAAHRLISYVISSEIRKAYIFCSREDLTKYIDEENIPPCLGGKCTRPCCGPSAVPEGVTTSLAEYLRKRNIKSSRIEKIEEFFTSVLERLSLN